MKKFKIGEEVTCSVTGIEKYGIFVSLDDYYSGLIHISEISSNFVRNINDYVKIGETIKAKVIDEDELEHHVKLSIKNLDDYRITRKNNNKIKETKNGFKTLSEKLDYWINQKKQELIEEKVKKI